jgi:L-asparaginase
VEPLVVELERGDVVEARHVVHAVAVRDGRIELAAGDPGLMSLLRSSAKPIQALPVIRARPDLDDEQVALLCSSHRASPEQLDVVRRILDDAPARVDDLDCVTGASQVEHMCSGKHAGFLALCRAEGWPVEGYRHADHPCQRAMLTEVAAIAEVDPRSIPVAVDGCGVPTFGLSLERAAHAFGRLRSVDGGGRVVRAICAHPELLAGPVATDARFPRAVDGWVGKGGAEGLFCAASAGGLGVALKTTDGAFRALAPALDELFDRLGVEHGELEDDVVRNAHGEPVGELRIAPS